MHVLEKVEIVVSNYWLNKTVVLMLVRAQAAKKKSWRESLLLFREDLSNHWQKLIEYGHRKPLERTTHGKKSRTLGA